jgi:BolA family transcriptional regulator, general stress-responsive regulator
MNLQALIETRLNAHFTPSSLSVLDESEAHYGHAGSTGGGKHFAVTMTAKAFQGLNHVKRHQLIYGELQDLMLEAHAFEHPELGYIHALKLQLHV